MANYNRAQAPYYDDYDSTKQYTHLLARPGRVAQAREITQIQSTVKDIIKSVGDSIFRDGNIIEGCQVSVDKERKIARVTQGRVYLNGMVLPLGQPIISPDDGTITLPTEIEIPIKGEGKEVIGFRLEETLITESMDGSLRDPAQGYDNFNQPGCDRIQSWVKVISYNPDDTNESREYADAAIFTTLLDGDVYIERYAPEYDTLTTLLADRTKDESGSYIVEGLNIRVVDDGAADNLKIVAEKGLAYINGYRIEIPSPRNISLSRSLRTISKFLTRSYSGDTVLSDGEYVKEITEVYSTLSSTIQMSNTQADTHIINLPRSNYSSLVRVVRVYAGNNTYTEEDYTIDMLSSPPRITWNNTNRPSGTYYIDIQYFTRLEENLGEYEKQTLSGRHILHWSPETINNNLTSTLVDGGSYTVRYEQYLARKDIVLINQNGDIYVKEGIPAEYGLEIIPESPANVLTLATISHTPGSAYNSTLVSNVGLTRFTMQDIQNLLQRVRNLEYNQSLTSLQEDTKQRTVSGTRKSIFTDPLIDFSKVDYYYNLLDGVKKDDKLPIYDATIDFRNNLCYLPTVSRTYDLTTSTSSRIRESNRLATLPKSGESIILSQMNATKSFMINPYSTFPQLPEITLSPAVDAWIEDTIVVVPVSQRRTETVSTSTRHIESTVIKSGRFEDYTVITGTTTSFTAIGNRVTTDTSESVINESAITYIRGREITVSGSNFPASLNNIICTFEGVKIPLTPIGSTEAGDEEGSIKATAQGTLSATFEIPAGKFLTGIREVRLETTIPGYASEGAAFALYQAQGTARTIQRTVTTLTTVLLNRITNVYSTTYIDPVGQTFVLDKMTMISGIDLYFEAAPDASGASVTCDIRKVVNGSITSTILAHKTLTAAEVIPYLSSDSSKATRFEFDDPVILEANTEYAFVVRSTSTAYRIWIAELGETNILPPNETVLSNPYLIGVMMSSSNNSSWTTHQLADIKFRLIADTYEEKGELLLENLNPEEAYSRLYLIAESIVPDSTSIDWEYSTDNGIIWNPISPYNIRVHSSMHSNLSLKAKLSRGVNNTLSPIIALDSISAVLSYYDTEGCYLSTEFPGNDYNKVDIILDSLIPDSTELKVYVSTDNAETRTEAIFIKSESPYYGWSETLYTADLGDTSNSNCKIIIELKSTGADENVNSRTPAFRKLRAITYKEE